MDQFVLLVRLLADLGVLHQGVQLITRRPKCQLIALLLGPFRLGRTGGQILLGQHPLGPSRAFLLLSQVGTSSFDAAEGVFEGLRVFPTTVFLAFLVALQVRLRQLDGRLVDLDFVVVFELFRQLLAARLDDQARVLAEIQFRQQNIGLCLLDVAVVLAELDFVVFLGFDRIGLFLVHRDLLGLQVLDQGGVIELHEEICINPAAGFRVAHLDRLNGPAAADFLFAI